MAALLQGEFILSGDLDVVFNFWDEKWLDEDPHIHEQLMSIEKEVRFMQKV